MSRQKDIAFYEAELAGADRSPLHTRIVEFILNKLRAIDDEEYEHVFGGLVMAEDFSYEDSKELVPAPPYEADANLQEETQDQAAALTEGAVTTPDLNHEWYDVNPSENN